MAINCSFDVLCGIVEQKGHVEEPDDWETYLGIGIQEEVTVLGSKKAGHGFRQNIVSFVNGLPPTSTPTPAQTTRLFSYFYGVGQVTYRTWRRVTRRH